MKPLPAGIIKGFEWLENPEDHSVHAMLDGNRIQMYDVPKNIIDVFLNEMMDNEEFMNANYYLSFPEKFKLYIRTFYARFDEVPDLDLTTMETHKEINLDLILTDKEKEVIPHLYTGEKYPTIASNLNITIDAFLKRLKGIFKKAGVHCARELLQMV